MLKKIFYLVLICGVIYRYFGVDFIIDKAPFLAPYLLKKSELRLEQEQAQKNSVIVVEEKNIERNVVTLEKKPEQIIVENVDGGVIIQRDGKVLILQQGGIILNGDILEAEDRSYAVLVFAERSRVKILAQSSLKISIIDNKLKLEEMKGKFFIDYSPTVVADKFIINSKRANYNLGPSMFYLEIETGHEKLVVLSGSGLINILSHQVDYSISEREGIIIDDAGDMIRPREYEWTKEFPWKNIGHGVINISQQIPHLKVQAEEDKENSSLGGSDTQNVAKKLIEKSINIEQVKKQMSDHYQEVGKQEE